jgi:hypothetical protein
MMMLISLSGLLPAALGLFPRDTTGTAPGKTGVPAPPLTVTAWLHAAKQDSVVRFGDGTVYVLGFTAYWCEACPQMYKPLMALAKRYEARNVHVMLVTSMYGTDLEFQREYFDHYGVTLPIAIDGVPNGAQTTDEITRATQYFATASRPWVIVIGPRGDIRFRLQGAQAPEMYTRMLDPVIDSLLASPPRSPEAHPHPSGTQGRTLEPQSGPR